MSHSFVAADGTKFEAVSEFTFAVTGAGIETFTGTEEGMRAWVQERFASRAVPTFRFLGREDDTRPVWALSG